MFRSLLRNTLMAAGAVAVVAGSASAQSFNFSTRGQFTTAGAPTCTSGVAITVVCTDPTPGSTLSLTFNGVSTVPGGFGNGSQVTLGTFTVGGQGNVLSLPTGVINFTLWIDQISPTTNSASTSGFITGTLTRPSGGPNFSDLVWTPTEIVNIDAVTYDLIFRAEVNGIVLSAAGNTTVEAIGTVVPEPGTYALMATGLAGLFFVARRRRSV